jgi:glycosyltransferase involved in cell wall biosynthesis
MLERNLNILINQTFKDFEIVISDNSENDEIKKICADKKYGNLNIKYFKNPRKGMAQNTNASLLKASGEIIKILYMDDYLSHKNSIKNIVDNFDGYWLVTGCDHDDGKKKYNPHSPNYNNKIFLGKNTIGSPSVLSIKNQNLIFFDEKMTWMLDCDYYKRLYDLYGEPTILEDTNVTIGTSDYQVTNILSKKNKFKELFYMIFKHKKSLFSLFNLW